MGSNLTVFLLQAGEGDLQAVVVDNDLVPPQGMHFLAGTCRIYARFSRNDCPEGLQEGRNERWFHALGLEPVNQEQFESFHHLKIILQKRRS